MKKILLLLLLLSFTAFSMPVETYIIPYFSKISGPYYKGGVDTLIIKDIKRAKRSVSMAMYYLTNKKITQALIDAHRRGLSVEVVTDDKKKNSSKYKQLLRAGITVHNDRNSKALMHNKILILDKKIVWIGSANYTVYSFYRNLDNFLKIEDKDIALYYSKKFKNLYTYSTQKINSYRTKELEIYFSPDTNFENKLISLVKNAKHSLYFLAFAFTNQKLADALVEAKARGVEVKGVFDKSQNKYQKYSQYDFMKKHSLNVKLDKNKFKLHSKVLIVDEKIVVTGSYNFTKTANSKNAENSIVIYSDAIAKKYVKNFEYIFKMK